METVTDFTFLGSKITADGDCSYEIKRHLTPSKKSYDKPRQHIKNQRHHFANRSLSSQSYGFSGSQVMSLEVFSPLKVLKIVSEGYMLSLF